MAVNNYNDAALSEEEKKAVSALGKQYQAAQAAGDTATMQAAHAAAEATRAKYGYSGGNDGSQYISTGAINGGINANNGLVSATNQSGKIDSVYSANEKAALASLESAYSKNLTTLDQSAAKIPQQYYEAANQAAVQAAQEKNAFNESAAASGLNTGAGSQAALAQSNVLQKDLTGIETAKANALKDVEAQRAQLATEYQNAVAEAILNNELEKAQALYNEAVRVDDSLVSTALNQANMAINAENTAYSRNEDKAKTLASAGDYSGYKALGYTDEQIAQMAQAAAAKAYSGGSGYGGTPATPVPQETDWSAVEAFVANGGDPDTYIKYYYDTLGFENESQAKAAYEIYNVEKNATPEITPLGDAQYTSMKSQISTLIKTGNRAKVNELIAKYADKLTDAQYSEIERLIGG